MLLLALAIFQAAQPPRATVPAVKPALQPPVTFGCDVPAGHYCAFTIFHPDGTRQSFGLQGMQRAAVRTSPAVDRYVVVIDLAAVQSLDACAALVAKQRFCKAAVVQAGYNN